MTATQTKHSSTCRRVWRRYDPECPRCRELAAGAPPRAGWSRGPDAETIRRWDREHDCVASRCGPVCTWGQW